MGPGSHQVFRDTDQHLSHVLLLAAGEVGPQLMGTIRSSLGDGGAARVRWAGITAASLTSMVDVVDYTQ